MAIVIKEIVVKTSVETRIIDNGRVSEALYSRLKEEILQELEAENKNNFLLEHRRNER